MKEQITVKKLVTLILCCLLLSSCAIGTRDKPLVPQSVPNNDSEHATVVFYVSDGIAGAIKRLGRDFIAVVDETEFKQDYPISKMLIANRKGHSVTKLSPGIHTFWLNSFGIETADLKAGATYYLSVRFEGAGGTGFLRFTDEDNFLKESKGAVEIRLTEGFGVSFLGKLTYKYELIHK